MPVGSFDKNPFGLYDMLGNVWEWTNDCVSSSPDPPDTSHRTANLAFCRASGGAWDNHEEWKVRWDSWALFEKDLRVPTIGFRVARELDDSEKQHPFRDCLTCPEMEIIPAGVVQVRSPPSRAEETCEQDRPTGSVPVISVGRLALGKYEVTINEWNACGVECSGDRSTDYEQSDGHRPIANVSWEDAKRYVNWLSTTTHRRYRLPTLDEWQHAAKDSTESCRYWGNEIGRGNANCGACGLTWHQLLDAVGLPLWWLDGP